MKIDKRLKWIILLSFVAIAFSGYLTYVHFNGDALGICSANDSIFNCEEISKSKYAFVPGVPGLLNSVAGIFGFAILAVIAGFGLKNKSKEFKAHTAKLLVSVSSAALLYSFYLTYIEFKIALFCPFCIASQIVIIIITFLAFLNFLDSKGIELVIE